MDLYEVMVQDELLEKAKALLDTIPGVTQDENYPNKFTCEGLQVCEDFSRGVFVL